MLSIVSNCIFIPFSR